jgi:hypothetical protein
MKRGPWSLADGAMFLVWFAGVRTEFTEIDGIWLMLFA